MALRDNWTEEEHSWDYFSNKDFKHEYSPRHTFGQDSCDFQERINWARMREYRYGRLQWAMKKHDIQALLLNFGSNIRYGNGTWDYQWKAMAGARYLLCFQDQPAYFFDTVGMDMEVTRMHCPWIPEDRLEAAITYQYAVGGFEEQCKRYWEQIKRVCKENGVDITKDKLGVDMIEIGGYEIGKSMGIKVIPAGKAVGEARYRKNRDELEALKIAAAWGDMCYWKAKYEFVKPGVREGEVYGKVSEFAASLGGQHVYGTQIASGGNSNPYIRAKTDKLIRQGDMVVLDCAINEYYGYIQDACRSWVVERKMTSKQKDVYKRCYEYLEKAKSVIKAGATTADIANTFPKYYDTTQKTCTLVQFAHTIGCGVYEGFWVSPGFSPDYPIEIEENFYMAVETWASDGPGGNCSVRLEDNIVVTKNGYQEFTLFPFEEEAVGFIENGTEPVTPANETGKPLPKPDYVKDED